MPRSTNPNHSDAEIVKPMALRSEIVNFGFGFLLQFRDHDFWVWDFEKRVWMFEEGEEEKGRTVLGQQMGKKKKNEGRRWSTGTRVLETRFPGGRYMEKVPTQT